MSKETETKQGKSMKTVSMSKKGNKAMVVISGDGDSETLHLQKAGGVWQSKDGRKWESIPQPGGAS